MTHRRMAQCCCEANPIFLNCNVWQQVCFGVQDPNNFPTGCLFNAGTNTTSRTYFCCNGSSYLQNELIYTASVSASGVREIESSGGTSCGIHGWGDQSGVRYRLAGSITSSFYLAEYDIQLNDFGDCVGSMLCRETRINAYGAINGCAACGSCPFPNPPNSGCGCLSGFSCQGNRGWEVNMGGLVGAIGSIRYFNLCCAGLEKIGEPCYQPLDPYDINASVQVQFRAGCAPVSSGCQQPSEGGCGTPIWGSIGTAGSGIIGISGQTVACSVDESSTGYATLSI